MRRILPFIAIAFVMAATLAEPLLAQRRGGGGFRGGGGGGGHISRGGARSSVARPANVSRPNIANRPVANRPVNVRDYNVSRNTNIDVDGCCYGGGRVAAGAVGYVAGAAVGAAAASVAYGSTVYSLPAGCVTTSVNGVTYQQCGSTWYQPQFVGDDVTYVSVGPP